MIKSLPKRILFRKNAMILLYNGIHTQKILLGNFRRREIPLRGELGIRMRKNVLQENSNYSYEITDEEELDDKLDVMKLEGDTMTKNDEDIREKKHFKNKVNLKITAQKFFSSGPQPSTLTYNDRLCIQYLHKQDPVQWNLKTLSESFPATPEAIKKILKSKLKFTPERAKKIDCKVQRNWELLSEGKLDAEPHVLEHLKKFINRKEVLLERIKSENFYLPEIKKEPVWNQGEMNSIIVSYEKILKQLAKKNKTKALSDRLNKVEDKENKEAISNLSLSQFKVKCETISETKDSFRFGDMINTYKKHTPLDEFKSKIWEKVDKEGKLKLMEKVILNDKMRVKKENNEDLIQSFNSSIIEKRTESSETENSTQEKVILNDKIRVKKENNEDLIQSFNSSIIEKRTESSETEYSTQEYDDAVTSENRSARFTSTAKRAEAKKNIQTKLYDSFKLETNSMKPTRRKSKEISYTLDYTPPDESMCFGCETNVAEILSDLQNKPQLENEPTETEVRKINLSVEEIMKQDKVSYDNEVNHIKDTPFWNDQRSSREKAMAELEKRDLEGTVVDEIDRQMPKVFVFNPDPYPERIKIPVKHRGSGLTFRVKDCYYDDDGKFLYRVPGMTR